MIRGLGIDIVEVDELRRQIEDIAGFLEEVFTVEEIECCKARPNPYECFAARFAAKEAVMKAFGSGWTEEVDFLKISIHSDGDSVPLVKLEPNLQNLLAQYSASSLKLSMTHTPNYACAVVVLDE
ncbi:MAG TPA: holo-ACP synthase [Alloacidobacterium sp.]|nr:holo-ACP synthase [Alloacidobacterium sp.]